MEKRLAKVNISAAGGTAASGAKTCKITLPTSWLTQMGIHEGDRSVELSFDGDTITIKRVLSVEEFIEKKKAAGHNLLCFKFYNFDELCTIIYADFTDQTLIHRDHTTNLVKTAFGRKETPSWSDLMTFLEERCIPRSRVGVREYLETIGVFEYDPIEIIRKTKGRMAEDHQWIEIEVVK